MRASRKTFTCAIWLLSLIVAFGGVGEPAKAASPSWQWKQQSGKESSDLRDIVVLDNGTRIALGVDTTVLRSANGGNWNPTAFPVKGNLTAAATDGKTAIVVGDGGVVALSSDGAKWTKSTVKSTIRLDQFNSYYKNKPEGKLELKPDGIRWMDAIWDGKQYVAVAEGRISSGGSNYSNPLIGVSANGSEWTLTPLVSTERVDLYNKSLQLVKFKSNWIAIASEGVFYSRDLKTWSFKKADIGATIHAAASNGDVLVAVGWDGRASTGRALGGAVFTSEDGLIYKRQPASDFYNISLNAVIWTDGKFVAAGHYGTLFESADGKKWKDKTQEHGDLMHALYYMKYGGLKGNIYGIAKTSDGFSAVGAKGAIRSAKGLDEEWMLEASGENGDLHGIVYSGGRYAIAGGGTFKISGDGSRWEDADPERVNDMTMLYNLYGTQSSFMATGFQFTTKLSEANLLYSGGTVTDISSALAEPIDDVSAAGGELRVFGGKLSASSKDGKTWTPLKGVQAIPMATNGKLWLGYRDSDLYQSKDGKTWTKLKATVDGYEIYFKIKQTVWTGTKFVAIGDAGLIESTDGKTWKKALSIRSENFNGLAASSSGAVAAVGDRGMIYMSDGKTWTKIASPTLKKLRSVVWDGKRFIAVGDGGVIVVGERK
ncbi:hypothetical protein [Cohnella terricola]|uniref:Photosynthesis system II assembly factor Ycf48/Hcf136-like domain-containing protein n=1 Tax=Cohnella terricola TaxID=1289167 RepID=A0A559JNE4_9BACL|nr:hypothetical protein [Cohnella terricola]TVY01395.1 hypothetical protein FPZ45_09670 [Cohnella terricola]